MVKMARNEFIKMLNFCAVSTILSVYLLTRVSFTSAEIVDKTNTVAMICHMKSCQSTTMNTTSIINKQCVKHNYTVSDRCCRDANGTIVGLDLSTCLLKSVPSLKNTKKLEWIALEDNPLKDHDLNTTHEAFRGLKNIQYLSLPSDFLCPGGDAAWNKTTEGKGATVCENELDVCVDDNSTYICPAESHCLHDGPGLIQCPCNKDWFGYKCLRSGDFPMGIYYGVLCACTLVICAFLWLTQRRNVNSLKKD